MKLIKNYKAFPLLIALMFGNSVQAAPNSTGLELVDALNGVFGKHDGARAVHSKGVIAQGKFTPDPKASALSKAIHFQGQSIPVTVRFSDFAGIPDIPDNHELAGPRGMAIKFLLPDHGETDIVTHSFNGFPSPTAEDFKNLLTALATSGPDVAKPTPLDIYLDSHPAAKHFLTTPKPSPVSFGTTSYFGVNTFKFINQKGSVTYGRYQIIPLAGNQYLSATDNQVADKNYLETELKSHLAKNSIKFDLLVEIAQKDDDLNDPSVTWSSSHKKVKLGTIEINSTTNTSDTLSKSILFMPGNLTSGIEIQDPMVNARSEAYAVSYGRRSQ
jgi:catalase